MSMYGYMTGMAASDDMLNLMPNGGDVINLDPGVPIPPPHPSEFMETTPPPMAPELKAFIHKLAAEKGPFIDIGKKTPGNQQFINWLQFYDPEWFMNYMALKMSMSFGAVSDALVTIPAWVKGETIRVRKDVYDLYLSSMSRVKNMLAEQGKVLSTTIPPLEFQSFMKWWNTYDPSGVASLTLMYTANGAMPTTMPKFEVPKKLYMHWKMTGGKAAPSKELLGFKEKSWLDWALDNWLWIAAGTAGGMVLGGWYVKNRAGGGMTQNPMHENMREGWGQTLKLKSGTYDLHPILPDSYVRSMKAMNMRNARKFRVSSDGISLGELHKSSGRYNWRARSYFGFEKYGNSRAALLAWLKDGALAKYEKKEESKPEAKPDREPDLTKREAALAKREAELKEAVDALAGGLHIPMPVMNRGRL